MKYTYYYHQQSPTYFGLYCSVLRDNFVVSTNLLSFCLTTSLTFNIHKFKAFIYIWFNVKLKIVKTLSCICSYRNSYCY